MLSGQGVGACTQPTPIETSYPGNSYPDPLNVPIKVNTRVANLLSMSERGDGAPTTKMPVIFGMLTTELEMYRDTLDAVLKSDLAAVNVEVSRLERPVIDPTYAKAEGCVVVP